METLNTHMHICATILFTTRWGSYIYLKCVYNSVWCYIHNEHIYYYSVYILQCIYIHPSDSAIVEYMHTYIHTHRQIDTISYKTRVCALVYSLYFCHTYLPTYLPTYLHTYIIHTCIHTCINTVHSVRCTS